MDKSLGSKKVKFDFKFIAFIILGIAIPTLLYSYAKIVISGNLIFEIGLNALTILYIFYFASTAVKMYKSLKN